MQGLPGVKLATFMFMPLMRACVFPDVLLPVDQPDSLQAAPLQEHSK